MNALRHIGAVVATMLVFTLAGCASAPKPTVITKREFVPVSVSPELLDLKSCPWPQGATYIILEREMEVIDYLLAGYEAWTCENDTRGAIKEQVERQEADIEARNKKQPTK